MKRRLTDAEREHEWATLLTEHQQLQAALASMQAQPAPDPHLRASLRQRLAAHGRRVAARSTPMPGSVAAGGAEMDVRAGGRAALGSRRRWT
jgi:hypothetical protein